MGFNWFECGSGWNKLVEPLVSEIESLGGTVQQVKEKYGSLRLYYTEGDGGTEEDWDRIQDAVDMAETQSERTCELCGEPGRVMGKGGWLKAVCKQHAQDLGYTRNDHDNG